MTLFLLGFIYLFIFAFMLKREKSVLNPSCFFVGYWFLLIFLHQFIGFDINANGLPLWIIFLMLVFFVCGSSLKKSSNVKINQDINTKLDYKFLKIVVLVGVVILFMSCLLLILNSPQGVSALYSFASFAEMSAHYATQRYRGRSEPIYFRVAMLCCYISVLLSAYLYSQKKVNFKSIYVVLPIISVFFVAAILTTKSAILVTTFLWLGVYLVNRDYYISDFNPFLKIRSYVVSVLCIFGLFFFFTIIQFNRYEGKNLTDYFFIVNRLRLDFFSFLAPISNWIFLYFSDPEINLLLGRMSFASLYSLIGVAEKKAGLYSESVVVAGFHQTNIYTMFRGLIMDFGILGSCILFFFLGYLITKLREEVRTNPQKQHYIFFVGLFYSVVFWSHIASLLNYNSIVVAVLVASALVWLQINRPNWLKLFKLYKS